MAKTIVAAGVGLLIVTSAPHEPPAINSVVGIHRIAAPAEASPNLLLGNGLGRLVAAGASGSQRRSSDFTIDQEALTFRDEQGRVLVDLTPRRGVDRTAFRRSAEALGMKVQSTDSQHGTLEGFVDLDVVTRLALLPETGTIAQALKPKRFVGAATSQGVAFQRVDKVHTAGLTGAGITVGALSDSFDSATADLTGAPLTIHAEDHVVSGDLPGTGNPLHPNPVVVLEDFVPGTDEGRGMLQIVHDVAPAAQLCFATAFSGEIGFANNIRRLADPEGNCGADVIVDDVNYLAEPFFSDGPISDAIDDVSAAGVTYLSAAGNVGENQAWESSVELVPASAVPAKSDLDLSEVPADLYDGGVQDFDSGPGTDLAQTLAVGDGGALLDLQWDDPVDVDGAELGEPLFAADGELGQDTPSQEFAFTPTEQQLGQEVLFRTDAVPSGTTDLILTVIAPDGTELATVDTGGSPESLATKVVAGSYRIIVAGFEGAAGDFTVDVRPVLDSSAVSTDFNALFFDMDGNYLGALADANRLTGRPSEIGLFTAMSAVQVVIARSGTDTDTTATTLRFLLLGNAEVGEYKDPLTPAIFGHATANGAIAVAAYDPFRPYLPEAFTSPGGDLPIYFDSTGQRLAGPEIRRKPEIAGTDGGNTTFFGFDTGFDPDTQPNFFGTSAAAPHAAAIAALILQQAGGPGSITPGRVEERLQRSAFRHDLDPFQSSGRAGGLTVVANGSQSSEFLTPGSMVDDHFFSVTYDGSVPLTSITFFGATASPTAPGTRGRSDGLVFDPRPFSGAPPFYDQGFPFTVGQTTGGLDRSQIAAAFYSPAPEPSVQGQFRQMTITFSSGLSKGAGFSFGVDRDTAAIPEGFIRGGNSADEIGGATFIPQGRSVRGGMIFTAVRADGRRCSGVMLNRIGSGWSPIDGYGLVNAERAVLTDR